MTHETSAPREGTFAAAQAAAEASGLPLWEVFLEREVRERGGSREALLEAMAERLEVMRASMTRGLTRPQHSRSGLVRGGAAALEAWTASGRTVLSPEFSRLVASALAVAEVNACMGRVVAAPTAGSCGVIPAVLFTAQARHGLEDAALVRALVTAGGIGLVIERLASLSGAEGGCQAEVGSASAMAAGALAELLGGTPAQAGHAAAFALANVLGLICDPVLGLVEVPCVQRNVMGAANAAAAAEMALAGLESPFAADAVIETMARVGRRLPEDFRETAKGGLAALAPPRGCAACHSHL